MKLKYVVMGLVPFSIGCASVHTEIVIEAPADKVWSVITDTASYPKWNPVMVSADGSHKKGEKLTYQVKAPGEKPASIKAKVKEMIPNSLLRQSGGIWGILTFDHQYKLEKVGKGTKVTQHEDYSGIGVLFWDHEKMIPAYNDSNAALKKRVMSLR